jgi:hypothetical protein
LADSIKKIEKAGEPKQLKPKRIKMNDKNIFNFTVGKLIEILQQHPQDMPVLVSGYKNGYENFYHPFVNKVIHQPENLYWDGQFQLDDNGTEVLLLERDVRID